MKLRRRLGNWRKKVIFIFTVVGCCVGFFVCFFYMVLSYYNLVVTSLRVPSRCRHTFPPHLQFFPVFFLQILEACLVVFAGCIVAKANFPRGSVCLWLMPTRFHERHQKFFFDIEIFWPLIQNFWDLWFKVHLFIHSVHFNQTTMYYLFSTIVARGFKHEQQS